MELNSESYIEPEPKTRDRGAGVRKKKIVGSESDIGHRIYKEV